MDRGAVGRDQNHTGRAWQTVTEASSSSSSSSRAGQAGRQAGKGYSTLHYSTLLLLYSTTESDWGGERTNERANTGGCEKVAGGGKPLRSITGWWWWGGGGGRVRRGRERRRRRREGQLSLDEPGGVRTRMGTWANMCGEGGRERPTR